MDWIYMIRVEVWVHIKLFIFYIYEEVWSLKGKPEAFFDLFLSTNIPNLKAAKKINKENLWGSRKWLFYFHDDWLCTRDARLCRLLFS